MNSNEYCRMQILPFISLPSRLESLNTSDMKQFEALGNCPACGIACKWRDVMALGGLRIEYSIRVVICEDCAHVTYSHFPHKTWLESFYRRTWDVSGREDAKGGGTSKREWKNVQLDHVVELGLSNDSRILDYGCGFGDDLEGLRRLGFNDTFGIELSEHRANMASNHFPGRVSLGESAIAQGIKDGNKKFDLVISRHVVEHLHAPFDKIKGLTEFLSDDGLLCILVPDAFKESPINTALFLPHLHLFNATSLMRMMRRAGLKTYTWKKAENQLVVVGSKSDKWKPSPNHLETELQIDSKYKDALADFISRPWSPNGSMGRHFIAYFTPSKAVTHPHGFQKLVGAPNQMAKLCSAFSKALPFLNDPRVLSRLRSLIRATGPSQFPAPNVNIIGFRALEKSHIPWISNEKGTLQVLVK